MFLRKIIIKAIIKLHGIEKRRKMDRYRMHHHREYLSDAVDHGQSIKQWELALKQLEKK